MSKTIKQIADELGVSKQAVHQKRKGKDLSTALQPFTSTVDGVVYISVDGEKLIKQAFLSNECKHVDVNEPSTIDGSVYGVLKASIDTLTHQLDTKDEQLAIKDKQLQHALSQNETLTAALAASQQQLSAAQALHAGTISQLPQPKKHFWQKQKPPRE